jgi:hypothetical protein
LIGKSSSIERWPNFKRAFVLKALFIASSLPLSCIQQAAAQPVSVPQLKLQHSVSYCKNYHLSGPDFMGLIKVIIEHGDLTDVSFIEKTIGSKFVVDSGVSTNGKSDALGYQTWQIQGTPIRDTLVVYVSRALQMKFDSLAMMNIESQTIPNVDEDFIGDCLHIPISNFYSFFGMSGNVSNRMATKEIRSGKNHSRIFISVSYNDNDNLVGEIEIYQKP